MAYGILWKVGALAAFGLVGAGTLTTSGCAGKPSAGPKAATTEDGLRSTTLEHEACDEAGHRVEPVGVDGDGKPNIKKVFDGSAEICRITDLNRDGHPDLFEYFDKGGELRRREFDFDDNGIVNQIDGYEGGKLAARQLDSANLGRIDTWDTFDPATGAHLKRERDANGDGRVDQWWSYEGDRVTILMDRNGDGLPDPEATIVLGPDGKPVSIADGGVAAASLADGGAGSPADGGALAPAPSTAATPSTSPATAPASPTEPSPAVSTPDAGTPGKPRRGGAKR